MTFLDFAVIWASFSPLIGGGGAWIYGVGKKQAETDARIAASEKFMDYRFEDLKEHINLQIEPVKDRLSRIERSMNGALRHD